MSKFLIPLAILGALSLAPRSPATQATPKPVWNIEPVGMIQPHPPVDIYYNPLPRGSGRRHWANQLKGNEG